MVKVKDISEIYYDDKEKHMNNEIYIDDGKELLKTNWVHNMGDKVILTVQNNNKDDKLICGIKETEIIKNMDENDLFKIICKIKKIDYETIIGQLIDRIKDSEIDDKDALIGVQETYDNEYYHIIKEEDVLFIDETFLLSKEEAIVYFDGDGRTYKDYKKMESELKYFWIETTDEEKEVIKIAQECKLEEIRVEMM